MSPINRAGLCGVVHTRLYDSDGAIGHVMQCIQTNGEFRG